MDALASAAHPNGVDGWGGSSPTPVVPIPLSEVWCEVDAAAAAGERGQRQGKGSGLDVCYDACFQGF